MSHSSNKKKYCNNKQEALFYTQKRPYLLRFSSMPESFSVKGVCSATEARQETSLQKINFRNAGKRMQGFYRHRLQTLLRKTCEK